MSGELKQYADTYGALEGFMMPETTVIWDFLFAQQRNMKLVGDFLEIGVFKGKSAQREIGVARRALSPTWRACPAG